MTRKVRGPRHDAKTTIIAIITNTAIFGAALYTLVLQGLIQHSLDTIYCIIYILIMTWMSLSMMSNVWKFFKKFDISYKEKLGFYYE